MRARLLVTLAAILLVPPSAFAGNAARPDAGFTAGSPATTNNDDSCDIGVYPAATLLLPYFDVDFKSPPTTAQTTLFTIVNVTRVPQIAHVTIWSDWAFPVAGFSIFLTGYDVQAINLYDVLARGIIAPPGGTSSLTTPGSLSAANDANPNFNVNTNCTNLPGLIPTPILAEIQRMLTFGPYSACGSSKVGGVHNDAIGYVTIDVVSTCFAQLPSSSTYFTSQILFDNALTGDYEQINPNPQTGNYAGGNPLVHIRAVPEGGPAGSIPGTNLPYTFYDRYTNQAGAGIPRTIDRRQPLPSAFAARYIEGGTGAFNTNYKIWREGVTGAEASCQDYSKSSALVIEEIVRFDEHESAQSWVYPFCILCGGFSFVLPATSAPKTSYSSTFPPATSPSGDVAGWMYLNLNNGGSAVYSATRSGFGAEVGTSTGARQSQNWVIVSMAAEGRYSVDFDATSLGNGCSPGAGRSSDSFLLPGAGPVMPIGPTGGVPVCPPLITCTPGSSYPGTNVTP